MSERAMMALFDPRQRLELRAGYWIEKDDDNRWQIGNGIAYLGYSLDTNVPVGKGGSFDAEAKRFAEAMQGSTTAGQSEGPDMPLAEARELLLVIRQDIEAKAYGVDEEHHRKRIAALDAALTAIDLLTDG